MDRVDVAPGTSKALIQLAKYSLLFSLILILVALALKVPIPKHEKALKLPLIMWYTEAVTNQMYESQMCTVKCFNGEHVRQCLVSTRNVSKKADAYIFYGSLLNSLPYRNKTTLFGLLHEESPKNIPEFMHEKGLNVFNYSATFSSFSSVPYPLLQLEEYKRITSRRFFVPTSSKNKFLRHIAPVLYMQTRCSDTTDRDDYVTELMKHIKVDSYGKCLNNRILPMPFYFYNTTVSLDYLLATLYDAPLLRYLSKYKFMIAIENGVCQDYVTEKFWRSIYMGVVPIYFGAPNIRDFLPNNKSAILISDYPTPELLARHLHELLANDTKYEEYLEHKVRGRITNIKIAKEFEKRPYQVIRGVHIEEAHIVKKRSIDQPLRISIFYDHSVYRLPPEKFDLINDTILPEAVQFWEKALKVRKTGGPIKLNRKCPSRQVFVRGGRSHCIDACAADTMCGEVRVPDYHLNSCYVCNSTGHNCRALPRTKKGPDENFLDGNGTTDAPIPEEDEEPTGIEDTDFILYVSAVETERCQRGLTVAYASHCQQESALDRPVAGHANFCPGELSTKYRDLPSVLSTVKHEMLHALGFSVSLFAFYRDDNGDPLTLRRPDTGNPPLDEELQIHKWSDRVVKTITRHDWMIRGGYMSRSFHMIVTPRVVKEVREHFNCSTLEGAELEDQGGDGTALTHWEKRVFENEAMTGTHTQNSVFSRITFALMEDTGWYRAEYKMATPLRWGQNLGCDFATKSCKHWINRQRLSLPDTTTERRNPSPFCERVKGDPLRTECSSRRDAVVLCNLVRHDMILPRQYQHFDILPNIAAGEESHYGGSVSLADYCPYLQEFTWKHKQVLVRGSRCSYEENTPKTDVNFALENYGAHSKCFDHSDRVWEQKSCRQIREWQHWGSGCYKYKCESGRLHIVVGNYSYTCYHSGQVLQVRIIKRGWLHKGGVVCPPCREMCGEEFASRQEYCKGADEAPPPNLYPNDILTCSVAAKTAAAILTFTAVTLTLTL